MHVPEDRRWLSRQDVQDRGVQVLQPEGQAVQYVPADIYTRYPSAHTKQLVELVQERQNSRQGEQLSPFFQNPSTHENTVISD